MNFERLRTQQSIEEIIGCKKVIQWNSYRSSFEKYSLTDIDVTRLFNDLLQDAEDIYFKGILCICEALIDISKGLHSWAVIMLYYSIFYFLRCSLAINGYSIIKNKCLYLLEIKSGTYPLKKNSKKYRNDHIGIINIYKDIFTTKDILLSNRINGESIYEWLMSKRHQIHYNQRSFEEPDYCDFMHVIKNIHDNNELEKLLIKYIDDQLPIYCFDESHACLAAPLKKAIITKNELLDKGLLKTYNQSKLDFIGNLLLLFSDNLTKLILT